MIECTKILQVLVLTVTFAFTSSKNMVAFHTGASQTGQCFHLAVFLHVHPNSDSVMHGYWVLIIICMGAAIQKFDSIWVNKYLLTLGALVQRGLLYLVCVSV